jgi:restriction endonuclease S subunit
MFKIMALFVYSMKQVKKPKYLYHGSSKKLQGNILVPKKAGGLGKKKDQQIGIYATDNKTAAIAMGLISGTGGSTLKSHGKKVEGVVYGSLPKSKFFYLCILPSNNFTKVDSWQWVSYKSIKPIKVEKLKVKDYAHLVRKATKEEKEKWELYRSKLRMKGES